MHLLPSSDQILSCRLREGLRLCFRSHSSGATVLCAISYYEFLTSLLHLLRHFLLYTYLFLFVSDCNFSSVHSFAVEVCDTSRTVPTSAQASSATHNWVSTLPVCCYGPETEREERSKIGQRALCLGAIIESQQSDTIQTRERTLAG